MFTRFSKIIFCLALVVFFVLFGIKSLAQERNLEDICQSIERIERECQILSPADCRALLEKCQRFFEEKTAQIEKDIFRTEKEKRTLKNQIFITRDRLRILDVQIRQSNLAIRNIGLQARETERSIQETSLKIENVREKLANILRVIHEQDQRSILAVLLAGEEIADFFTNLVALETINLKNQNVLGEIVKLKSTLEEQKVFLAQEEEEFQRVVAIQMLQTEENIRTKRQQERLHRMTEAEFQRYLREKAEVARRAAEIRARIVQLVGIPDAAQLSFGELLNIAEVVQGQTGIRPAFLLAIITQESALGRNVGQCHIADKTSGASIHIRKGTRFSNGLAVPSRSRRNDLAKFLKLTNELGLNPLKTPISCPMRIGFGGAMGPAQFIPTTWANRRHILEPFVEGVPNPWNVNHAFLASALYLRDNGGQANERRAALKYFAGGNWWRPHNAFYGDQVVRRINCLQVFIDHGTITSVCERMIFVPR